MLAVQLRSGRRAAMMTQLVPDAIDDGLPEIGLEGAFTPGLETPHLPERPEERFLDEVVRVGQVPGPPRQPSARPSPQPGQISSEKRVERAAVTGAHALQELES